MDESGWLRRILALLVIVALALFLWGIVTVLLIVFGAILFSILLCWLASLTDGALRIGRGPALSLVLVLILSALGAAFWLFGSEISMQLGELATSLPESLDKIRTGLQASDLGRFLVSGFGRNISISVSRVTEILGSGAALIISFFLILFGGIYLAAEPELYRSGILELVPRNHVSRAEGCSMSSAMRCAYGCSVSCLRWVWWECYPVWASGFSVFHPPRRWN
jgi:predicted PurR-regulated permease PerM